MKDEIERRAFAGQIEFRAAADGDAGPGTLVGYALKFNTLSRDLGGWFEEIDPGAFGSPTADGGLDLGSHTRVICRSEHDSRNLLGTTDSGTLRVTVDDVGVLYEVDLPDTTAGRDAAVLAERGDYRYSSFAFRNVESPTWREGDNDQLIRTVVGARLIDVAPVADPAYWSSTVGKRDIEEARAELHPASEPDETEPRNEPGDFERHVAEFDANTNSHRDRDFRRGIRSRIGGEKGVR